MLYDILLSKLFINNSKFYHIENKSSDEYQENYIYTNDDTDDLKTACSSNLKSALSSDLKSQVSSNSNPFSIEEDKVCAYNSIIAYMLKWIGLYECV